MQTSRAYRRSRSRPRKRRLLRDCRYKTARQRLLAMELAQRRADHNKYRAWRYRAPMFPAELAAMMFELSPRERQQLKLTEAPIPGMPLKTT